MSNKKTMVVNHLKNNMNNYGLLLFSVILIGCISPNGVLNSVFTTIFLYIFTFCIGFIKNIVKPLSDFLTKAGNARLFNSEVLGFGCTVGWFSWLFGINYIIHRYTGFQFLDPFIIIFWILLYFSIHSINFLLLKKSKNGGRELTELINLITNNTNTKQKITNMGKPKLNIIFSTLIIYVLILTLKSYPQIISIGEGILSGAEDTVFSILLNSKIKRYPTNL